MAGNEGWGDMRGTVSGGLWAIVLGAVGLGTASLIGAPPKTPPAAAPEAPASATADTAPASDDVATATVEPAETTSAPAVVAAPAAAPADAPSVSDTAVTPPASGDTDVALATPDPVQPVEPAAADPVAVETETAAPVVSETASTDAEPAAPDTTTAPGVVADADDPVVTPDDAAPAQPVVAADNTAAIDEDTAAAVTPPTVPEPALPEQTNTDIAALDAPQDDAPAAAAPAPVALPEPEQDAVVASEAVTPADPEPAAPVVTEAPIAVAPAAPEAVEPAPAVAAVEEPPAPVIVDEPIAVLPAPETEIADVDPAPSDIAIADAEPAAPTVLDVTADDTRQLGGNTVRVNRPGAEDPAEAEDVVAETPDEATIPDDAPAIVRFATPFENPAALPLVSLVLRDGAGTADLMDQVSALTLPVTIVIDPTASDATARMQAYRARGVEVAIQASLPAGATPSDVEIAMEAAFAAVPEAVALFSDGSDGIQSDRAVTAQVMEYLSANGRGLVMVQQGLGNALRAAAQAEVPATAVSRELGREGADVGALTRALDQAAFRARQTGDSVLLSDATETVLTALSGWQAGVDEGQFLVAPVTAIIAPTVTNTE
ncbi:divergent polysaccharide deacetylase family protein [Yoonia sp. SS1-5]|uniref:Divergent polysaccharide deacetylase family protein n=1 Tax=Yoonia rhodophyticola TaxID=3137370 RepID=A0AAN0M7L4_9RHOB